MGKIRSLLGSFAIIFSLFFVGNAFATGYVCDDLKTYVSCNAGYYLEDGICKECDEGCTCNGEQDAPICSEEFTITYNLNGGYGTTPGSTTCLKGQSCTLASDATTSFRRDGYVFKGWNTDKSATTGSTSLTFDANTTVYAIWSACAAGTYKSVDSNASASCSACPNGYRAGGTGLTSQYQCAIQCSAGYSVMTPGGACTTAKGGWATYPHKVRYSETSPIYVAPFNFGTTTTTDTVHSMLASTAMPASMGGVIEAGQMVVGSQTNYLDSYLSDIRAIRVGNFDDSIPLELLNISVFNRPISDYASAGVGQVYDSLIYQQMPAQADMYIGNLENLTSDTNTAEAALDGYVTTLDYNGGYVTYKLNGDDVYFVQLTYSISSDISADDIPSFVVQADISGYGWVDLFTYDSASSVNSELNIIRNGEANTIMIPAMALVPCGSGTYRAGTSSLTWSNVAKSNSAVARCTSCAAGKYQPGLGQSSCIDASKGYYVDQEAATRQTKCPAGTYGATTGLTTSSCSGNVAAGYYSTGGATTATGDGTVDAGYYSTGGATSYAPIGPGDGCLTGNDCGVVAAGYYSTGGAINSTPSSSDCNGDNPDSGTSNECGTVDAGCYSTGAGTSSCPNSCATGTYQPSEGQSSCIDASKGYYVDTTGATSQTACTGATYSETEGQTSCTACPTVSGAYSYGYNNTGSTGDHTTIAGCYATFVPTSNGTYVPNGGVRYYSCYVDTNSKSSYGVDGSAVKDCWIPKEDLYCERGYYNTTFNNTPSATQFSGYKKASDLAANACVAVGSGYWSRDYELTRGTCSALDTTKTNGTYSSVAPYDDPTRCRFTENDPTVPTYCTSKTSNTVAYNGSSWPATTYTVSAKPGSIISGNNTASATCSQCSAGTYSAGGSTTTCDTIAAGYWGSAGATTATGDGTIDAGYYSTGGATSYAPIGPGDGCLTGNDCGVVAAGYYSAGGAYTATPEGGIDCDSGDCGMIEAGYYSTGGAINSTPGSSDCNGDDPDSGTFNECGLVNSGCYGSAGATTSCPNSCSALTSGGFYSQSAAGSTSSADCYGSLDGGQTIPVANQDPQPCQSGYACPAVGDAYYGQTFSGVPCNGDKYQNEEGQSLCKICTLPDTEYDTWAYYLWSDSEEPQEYCELVFVYADKDSQIVQDKGLSEIGIENTDSYQPFKGGIIEGGVKYVPGENVIEIESFPMFIEPGYWTTIAGEETSRRGSFKEAYEVISPVGAGYWAAGSSSVGDIIIQRNACPVGYVNGSATAGSESECAINVTGGHYIGTVGQNSSNWGICPVGEYQEEHTVFYGDTSSCTSCGTKPDNASWNGDVGATSKASCEWECNIGYEDTNNMCTPMSYSIIYELNSGTNYTGAPSSYTYGTAVTISGIPTRSGHVFGGWCTDADLTSCDMTQTISAGEMGGKTFYAKWQETTCSATNGTAQTVIANNQFTCEITCNDGYNQTGNKGAETFTLSANSGEYSLSGECKIQTYTITYHLDSDVENPTSNPTSYTVEDDITLKSPTRNGYGFMGWYSDSAKTQSFSGRIHDSTVDIELWADWEMGYYNIRYSNMDGADNNPKNLNSYSVTQTPITLYAPTKTGYLFAGWTMDGKLVTEIAKDTADNITLNATWTPIQYTVKFNTTDAGTSLTTLTCTYDQDCGPLPDVSMQYKTFKGWDTQSDGKGTRYDAGDIVKNLSAVNNDSVTLYAIWEQKRVTCQAGYYFEANNTTPIVCELGQYCPGEGMIDEGAAGCIEICPDGGETKASGADKITQCYKIVEEDDSGLGFAGATKWNCQYSEENETYSDNCALTDFGCMAGYYYDSQQNQYECIAVESGYYSPEGETALMECPSSGSIVDSDSGRDDITDCYITCDLDKADVSYSTSVTPKNHKEYSNADGQYSACSYTVTCESGYNPVSGTSPKCAANEYTVTFDTNGGNGNVDSVMCTFGDGCALPATTNLTRIGYNSENKWCEKSDGKGTCYTAGATEEVSASGADITLYAIWTPMVFKVELDTNGATSNGDLNPVYLQYETGWFADSTAKTPITALSQVPQKSGYGFTGFQIGNVTVIDVNGNFIKTPDVLTVTLEDTTAMASWEKDKVTCNPGYYYEGFGGTCALCEANYWCPGGRYDTDSGVQGGINQCPADKHSDAGADSETDCYGTCTGYAIKGGNAVPVNDKIYGSQQCEYRGMSYSGNPCVIDMVNGEATCIEVSCNPDFELINGRCQECNRDNATAYKPNGNCLVAKCHNGYHPDGDQCADNIKTCNAPNAISATQEWDSKAGSFGICKITECQDGYHIASNACVPDVEACEIEHGRGEREWNHKRNAWGECIATYCAPGYTNDSYDSDEPNKQCGRCRNSKSVLGQDAASTYVEGCEIATCLYQGELYKLENNECVPICQTYEDETGTMRWNSKTRKCERECKEGYMSW